MRKIKIALFALIVICFAGMLMACSSVTEAGNTQHEVVDDVTMVKISDTYDAFQIFVHKETRVMYIFYRHTGDEAGFTVLLDEDGKPMKWRGAL